MGGLMADRTIEYSLGDLLSIPMAAGARIFGGALVCSDADGYAVPAADAAGFTFQGVAAAAADNRNGQDAAVRVVVRRRGRYRLDCASRLDQSAMSARMYVVNDHTVGAAWQVVNDVLVGVIDRVESSEECWLSIDAAVLRGKTWPKPQPGA